MELRENRCLQSFCGQTVTHTHRMAGQLAAEGNIENVSAVGLLCSTEVSFCSVILRELKLTHKCWGINAL